MSLHRLYWAQQNDKFSTAGQSTAASSAIKFEAWLRGWKRTRRTGLSGLRSQLPVFGLRLNNPVGK